MRITGGIHRSRTLVTPFGWNTRPTADRVKESLFSILWARHGIVGARVLDLYAGTGALGLEALSRGAKDVTSVESAEPALLALRTNIDKLGLRDRVRVVVGEVEKLLPRLAKDGPFDLVLVDPPYVLATGKPLSDALSVAVTRGLLAPAAWVMLEHLQVEDPPAIPPLELRMTRVYGRTALSFFALPEQDNMTQEPMQSDEECAAAKERDDA